MPFLAQYPRHHALVVPLRILVYFVSVAVVVVGGVIALQKVERVTARHSVAHDVVGDARGIAAELCLGNAKPGLLGALVARKVNQPPSKCRLTVLCPKEVALKGAARAVHEPVTAHCG